MTFQRLPKPFHPTNSVIRIHTRSSTPLLLQLFQGRNDHIRVCITKGTHQSTEDVRAQPTELITINQLVLTFQDT